MKKYIKITLNVILFSLLLISCGGNKEEYSNSTINNKEEYFKLKKAVIKCKRDFKTKKISSDEYADKMERYGDIYMKNVDAIPPERRYRVSIYCFKEALKYDKKNKELKEKLQKQKKLFSVVNQ